MIYTKKLMKILSFTFFAFFITSISTSNILAEQTTGVIRGSVVDGAGNPVIGASVQILHSPSGSKSSTSTGNSGAFYSRGLRLGGPFKITVTKSGQISTKSNNFYGSRVQRLLRRTTAHPFLMILSLFLDF